MEIGVRQGSLELGGHSQEGEVADQRERLLEIKVGGLS